MNIPDSHKNSGRRSLRIGVTGGVGSGKSLVCKRLEEHGVSVCSADEFSRRAVEPGTRAFEQIVQHFGRQVLTPEGRIDRPRLRRLIIGDDAARKVLESFVHPEVLVQMEKHFSEAQRQETPMVAAEVPLLFEAGMEKFFDAVIFVSSDRENRLQRVMERDRVSRREAEALMKAQMSEEQKLARADYIIDNNGNIEQMREEVDRIYEALSTALKNLGEKY